jgi:Ca2+-binding RTX toxin-like protein
VTGTTNLTLSSFDTTVNGIEEWRGNNQALVGNGSANLFNLSALLAISSLLYVDGGGGNDTVTGSDFADDLRGGGGDDTVTGGGGGDTLTGGAGNDTLTGDDGNDTLTGGTGIDNVTAGSGDDIIVVTGTEAVSDTIDAGTGAGDVLRVGGTGAVTLASFDAAASGLEVCEGNGQALLGNTGANNLDLSGLASVTGSPLWMAAQAMT